MIRRFTQHGSSIEEGHGQGQPPRIVTTAASADPLPDNRPPPGSRAQSWGTYTSLRGQDKSVVRSTSNPVGLTAGGSLRSSYRRGIPRVIKFIFLVDPAASWSTISEGSHAISNYCGQYSYLDLSPFARNEAEWRYT